MGAFGMAQAAGSLTSRRPGLHGNEPCPSPAWQSREEVARHEYYPDYGSAAELFGLRGHDLSRAHRPAPGRLLGGCALLFLLPLAEEGRPNSGAAGSARCGGTGVRPAGGGRGRRRWRSRRAPPAARPRDGQHPASRRAPCADAAGATRMRIFHAKLSDGAVGHLDHQINDWLDQNPEIEIKFANTTVGVWEGKHAEPNLILTLFY